jgi:hypothetical protein
MALSRGDVSRKGGMHMSRLYTITANLKKKGATLCRKPIDKAFIEYLEKKGFYCERFGKFIRLKYILKYQINLVNLGYDTKLGELDGYSSVYYSSCIKKIKRQIPEKHKTTENFRIKSKDYRLEPIDFRGDEKIVLETADPQRYISISKIYIYPTKIGDEDIE